MLWGNPCFVFPGGLHSLGCSPATCLLIWALLIFLCPFPPGLIGNLYLNNNPLKNFKIYSLDMTKKFFQRWVPVSLVYEVIANR